LREALIQRGVARNLASSFGSVVRHAVSHSGTSVLPSPENRGTASPNQHTVQPIRVGNLTSATGKDRGADACVDVQPIIEGDEA